MKRNFYLLLFFLWPLIEYWVYVLISFGTCNFQFRITDYGYILHFITNLTLEILFLVLFKDNRKIKFLVGIHFIIFIILFLMILFFTKFTSSFENFPEPCSINVINKIT